MRRIIIGMIVLSFMLSCVGYSEASKTDDAVVFMNAVEMLKQIKNRQSVADAQELFAGISSNYNQANMFSMYASAIVDIYDENYNEAQNKLTVLRMNSDFEGLLKKQGLPDCSVLENYIIARQAETEGKYDDALSIYTSINFLDSLERSVNIVGMEQKYNQGNSLMEEYEYNQAYLIFSELGNYKDSAGLAEECNMQMAHIPEAPKVGERVQFGRFYRDINKKLEPLEWIIIQVNKNTGTIVLMSHYGLHGMQYSTKINTNKDSTDYESSKVREWLTTEFYDIAFNSDEKLSISPFRLNEYGVEDMVYIPSVHQMDSWKINGVNIEDLKVMPTVYARRDGIYLYSDQKGYGYWLRTKAGEWYDDNRYWVYFYTDDFYGTYPTDIVLVRPCITIKY